MAAHIRLKDIKGIVRRRKWYFIAPFLGCIAIALGALIYLPPIYKSEATIIIENQEIPEEYVKSTITTYLDERLQMIQRKIMSHAKLIEIIKSYDLYPDLVSDSEKIAKMREDIKLQTINAAINNESTGRTSRATIAFILSYEGAVPRTVKIVTQTLANLYIEEDRETRKKFARTTATFFEQELNEIKENVHQYEEKIRFFKEKNLKTLPGSLNVNLQSIARMEQDLDRIDTRVLTLREKKIYLDSQIVNVDPLKPILTDQGRQAINPQEHLKALRLQLIRMEASMSSKHPDIKAIKSEIAQLEKQFGYTDAAAEKRKQLKLLQSQLSELKGKYGEKHPDYIKLSKQISILTKEVENHEPGRNSVQFADDKPDNPAYMNLRANIIAIQTELDALDSERRKIKDKIELYQQKIEVLPVVEEEYSKLMLDYENAKHKYNEVLNKLLTAKISEEMDVSQRGERFSILEPAYLPVNPYKPDKIKITLLGIVLGAGIGLCIAALFEGLDASVKTADEVENILPFPVLSSVSFFNSQQAARRPWRK